MFLERIWLADGTGTKGTGMNGIRILSWVVIGLMSALAVNIILNSGMDHGVGFDVFLAGSGDPWQLFINNDLVTGLLFIFAWIVFREQGTPFLPRLAWLWMLMWWGNIVTAAYVLYAARQSRGDWSIFFLGRRAAQISAFEPAPALRIASAIGAVATAVYLVWGVTGVGFAPIPTFGYVLGFAPIVLSFALIAAQPSRSAQR